MTHDELDLFRCPVCLLPLRARVANSHPHGTRQVASVRFEPRLEPEPLVLLADESHRVISRLRNWRGTWPTFPLLVEAAWLRRRLLASAAEDPEQAHALESCLGALVRAYFEPRPAAPTPERTARGEAG